MTEYQKQIRDIQLKAIIDYFQNLDRIVHYDMDELNDETNRLIGEVWSKIDN